MARAGETGQGRIAAVDIARTLALAGMVVFHFSRDLEMFGLLPPGATLFGGWALFARLVAGSFLFLAGVSLWLAHGRRLRWGSFLRRLCVIAAAAALVTAATWAAMPQAFIFYGILHSIAVASVAGLAFLRLPAALTLAVAAAVFALPWLWQSPAFNAPWLVWTGLGTEVPRTLDFEPLFPWLAPFLAGLALARLADRAGLRARLAALPANATRAARALAWPGRHSLAIYLIHQPVLIGLLWTATRIG
jgi:uncharacterized membrane protein